MKVMRVVKNGNIINLDGFQYVIHSDEYLVKKYVEVRYYRNNDKGFFIDGEKIEVSILDDKKMAA